MILTYYKGNNFGDAMNPMIFNHLLPGFFDDDPAEHFLGIGSILGFEKGDRETKKLIVFSSGFAYDQPPVIDDRYDIRCVRGPMTASVLKLDKSKAVTDGAVLLRHLPEFQSDTEKKYKYSYVPHHESELIFDRWEPFFDYLDIHFISPANDPMKIVNDIRQSECVYAESLHAAIVADAFRVPWIPVNMFWHINSFKWQDWMLSMEMEDYKPYNLPRIYNMRWIRLIIQDKLGLSRNNYLNKITSQLYRAYQTHLYEKKFVEIMKNIAGKEPLLSKDAVIKRKSDQLLEILEGVKKDYEKIRS